MSPYQVPPNMCSPDSADMEEEEETSVLHLLKLINLQLKNLQTEVQDVRRDLSRMKDLRKTSWSSAGEEPEAPGETSRNTICVMRHYSLGITLKVGKFYII